MNGSFENQMLLVVYRAVLMINRKSESENGASNFIFLTFIYLLKLVVKLQDI